MTSICIGSFTHQAVSGQTTLGRKISNALDTKLVLALCYVIKKIHSQGVNKTMYFAVFATK